MFPKRIKTLSGLIAACVLLAGCTGPQQSSSTGSDHFSERGPITFVSAASKFKQELVDQWNASHPQEQVRYITLPVDPAAQAQQMVQNAQTKSDAFTVLYMDPTAFTQFAANQWISQLPADTIDRSKFVPALLDTATYRSNLYAVPTHSDTGMFFYRKDLLDKAGITQPPRTWAEMQQACQKVLALQEAAGMSCYTTGLIKTEDLTVTFLEAVTGAGGAVFDKNGKPDVNTPEAKAALDSLADGYKSGMIPRDAIAGATPPVEQDFIGGKVVFARNWPYMLPDAEATDGSSKVAGKVGMVAEIPGVVRPDSPVVGGHDLAISKFAKNKGTALDFVKFFTSEEAQRTNLEKYGYGILPSLSNLYDDPALQAKFPSLATLKEAVLSGQGRPLVVDYSKATQAIQDNVYAALTGDKTSAQALADMQSSLQDLTKP